MILGKRLLALSTLTAAAVLGGCSGDGDEGPGPGETVWTASVRTLVIASSGGGLVAPLPGSRCSSGAAEHTLEIATLELDSVTCESNGGPLQQVQRSRTLTATEMAELEPALQRLEVVDEEICGADKPAITLTVTTASGTREYRDSFYSCLEDPRPTIASVALDEVLHRLNELAINAAR
jgi:hypothetical protein